MSGAATFDAAIVLGSGWSAAADALGTPEREIPVAELGGFPAPSTPGHHGSVRVLRVADGNSVLVFLGRVHMYEGTRPAPSSTGCGPLSRPAPGRSS